jgi:hypothetical protein
VISLIDRQISNKGLSVPLLSGDSKTSERVQNYGRPEEIQKHNKPMAGIEPTTFRLLSECSTPKLHWQLSYRADLNITNFAMIYVHRNANYTLVIKVQLSIVLWKLFTALI